MSDSSGHAWLFAGVEAAVQRWLPPGDGEPTTSVRRFLAIGRDLPYLPEARLQVRRTSQ